jgi:predicted AlkP superfamily phosphohydrolase/phosphomutase
MSRKLQLLIIGVDGAGPDLVARFVASGSMPYTAKLIARGAFGPLASTVPPTTFPAWTSFLTGAPPSWHGIPDFTIRSRYRVRFAGARDRALPTLFAHLERRGLATGAAWFPATYPPEPLRGFSISGWDSPVTSAGDASFVLPHELGREMESRFFGDHLAFEAFDEFGGDPCRDVADRVRALVRATQRRAEIARWLLSNRPVDVAAFYFGAADTAAHHFWAFFDPSSPRRPACVSPEASAAIESVYRAIDEAIGVLVEAAGDGAAVVVLSDHGSRGSSDVALYLNRALAEAGLLSFSTGASKLPYSAAARSSAVAAIPRSLRRRLFRFAGGFAPSCAESALRFSGIDWGKTRAFSEELSYAPSIWLNQLGREPQGIVPYRERAAVARDVATALRTLALEDGLLLVDGVALREDVHRGPQRRRLPDIAVVLRDVDGHTPVCLPSRGPGPSARRLQGDELLGRKGRSMPGCHAGEGILIAVRPDSAPPSIAGAAIEDVAVLACDLLGVARASWFVRRDAVVCAARPGDSRASSRESAYSLAEERAIAARLRGLGYLEE